MEVLWRGVCRAGLRAGTGAGDLAGAEGAGGRTLASACWGLGGGGGGGVEEVKPGASVGDGSGGAAGEKVVEAEGKGSTTGSSNIGASCGDCTEGSD